MASQRSEAAQGRGKRGWIWSLATFSFLSAARGREPLARGSWGWETWSKDAADAPDPRPGCGCTVWNRWFPITQNTLLQKRGEEKKAITPPLRGEKWCVELRSVLPRGPQCPPTFPEPCNKQRALGCTSRMKPPTSVQTLSGQTPNSPKEPQNSPNSIRKTAEHSGCVYETQTIIPRYAQPSLSKRGNETATRRARHADGFKIKPH